METTAIHSLNGDYSDSLLEWRLQHSLNGDQHSFDGDHHFLNEDQHFLNEDQHFLTEDQLGTPSPGLAHSAPC